MFLFNPEKKIPEQFRELYTLEKNQCIRARTVGLCVTIVSIYLTAIAVNLIFELHEFDLARAMYLFSILVAGAGAILLFNAKTDCLPTAKLNAFLFTVLLLFIFAYGPQDEPEVYSQSAFILSLFFTTLIIPWHLRDTFVLIAFHYIAFSVYYMSRDLAGYRIPPTFFGDNPYVTGVITMGFAAFMCLVIRYKDNARDIERFVLLKDVETRKAQMEEELEFASRVHDTLIPKSLSTPEADIFVNYHPVSSIGGDYAKFQFVDKDNLIFFMSDVTGHGVPAALMVNRLHAEFNTLVRETKEPGELLKRLNDFIFRDFEGSSIYISALCGRIDFKEKKIYYSNYGHPPQYLHRFADSDIVHMESHTTLLGIAEGDGETIYQGEIPYREGDMILLFTDGVLEAKDDTGEEYGAQRIEDFMRKNSSLPLAEMNKKLMDDLSAFSDGDFRDDVFVLSIKTHPKESKNILSDLLSIS